jgi:hypothetical protein
MEKRGSETKKNSCYAWVEGKRNGYRDRFVAGTGVSPSEAVGKAIRNRRTNKSDKIRVFDSKGNDRTYEAAHLPWFKKKWFAKRFKDDKKGRK